MVREFRNMLTEGIMSFVMPAPPPRQPARNSSIPIEKEFEGKFWQHFPMLAEIVEKLRGTLHEDPRAFTIALFTNVTMVTIITSVPMVATDLLVTKVTNISLLWLECLECIFDFKLSPCSKCCMLSFGYTNIPLT
jgi:hypothetical protein